MSTRSRIGITNDDGSITSIYSHSDGYPSYVGLMLQEHYNTPERIRDLLALGDIGLLDKRLNPDFGMPHKNGDRQNGVTLAAIRDGHAPEEENMPKTFTDRADYINNGTQQCEVFLYVFDSGYWYCYSVEHSYFGWIPVERAVELAKHGWLPEEEAER